MTAEKGEAIKDKGQYIDNSNHCLDCARDTSKISFLSVETLGR